MPKSNTEKGGEVCEEQCFSSSLPVGKTGLGTWWHPTKHWKGAGGSGVGSGVHFLSFPRLSFNSTLPHCPQVHPFLEPGGACEVCVCGKCWEGAFIETKQSGTFRIVFPPAPHPLAASLAVSLLLSPRTKNALNAWRLLQCQITKG